MVVLPARVALVLGLWGIFGHGDKVTSQIFDDVA